MIMLKMKHKRTRCLTLPDDATMLDFQHRYRQLVKEYFARVANGSQLMHHFLPCCPGPAELRNLSAEDEAALLDENEAVMGPLLAAISLGQVALTCPHQMIGHAYSSSQLGDDLVEEMAACQAEELIIALTDIHNELIGKRVLFRGGLAECQLYPDRIFNYALRTGAKGVVMVHNHPTGDINPSKEDLRMMNRLNRGCDLLGLCLLDCFIIGRGEYYSWRESAVDEEIC